MNPKAPMNVLAPIALSVGACLSLIGLSLFASAPSLGTRLMGAAANSIVVILCIIMWVLYVKSYVDSKLTNLNIEKSDTERDV